jgi:DNA topoisomerase-1
MTISLETAISLIESKRSDTQKMMINEYKDGVNIIQVKNGRFGPYIAVGKTNYKIPKDVKPEELTLEDCKIIMEKQVDRPKRAPKRKK